MARTCICGRRVESGNYCPACTAKRAKAPVSEAERTARMPWRKRRSLAEYRRNRAARYRLVGGRCEDCHVDLLGEYFPSGMPWECDHVIELRHGGSDEIENLRCRCLDCHHKKTAAVSRARRYQ